MALRGPAQARKTRTADMDKWTAEKWLVSLDLSRSVAVAKALSSEAVYSAVNAANVGGGQREKLKIDRARDKLESLRQELEQDDDVSKPAIFELFESVAKNVASTALLATREVRPQALDELEFYKATGKWEGKGVTDVALKLALGAQSLGGLADHVWEGVKKLRTAGSDTLELQEKFLANGAGLMKTSGITEFFSGLEGKIGSPDANVSDAMEAEHCMRLDSLELFTSSNYEIKTTSEQEWCFVADTKKFEKFPEEKKINMMEELKRSGKLSDNPALKKLADSNAKKRKVLDKEEILKTVDKKNEELRKKGVKENEFLKIVEAYGARLYTGAMATQSCDAADSGLHVVLACMLGSTRARVAFAFVAGW